MSHDPMASMMWVGALMAFAPIVFAGVVIGVWWYQKRKTDRGERPAEGARGRPT